MSDELEAPTRPPDVIQAEPGIRSARGQDRIIRIGVQRDDAGVVLGYWVDAHDDRDQMFRVWCHHVDGRLVPVQASVSHSNTRDRLVGPVLSALGLRKVLGWADAVLAGDVVEDAPPPRGYRPATDERHEQVCALWHHGGVDAVVKRFGISRRSAFRWWAQAQDAGHGPGGDCGRWADAR
jgi:hypothetical protein